MSFTHLNVASSYSAHYGVSTPPQLAAAAHAMGAEALALTDRDGLYGAVKHVAACMEHGLQPLLGVNLALLDTPGHAAGRVILLARGHSNGAGYAALCRSISQAHQAPRGIPGLTRRQLAHRVASGNLMLLVGGESDVARALARGQYAKARALLAEGQWTASMDELLEIIMRDKKWNDEAARKTYVAILELLTPPPPKHGAGADGKSAGGIELTGKAAKQEDPQAELLSGYRRKLSMALN